jgi:hypothetical protein
MYGLGGRGTRRGGSAAGGGACETGSEGFSGNSIGLLRLAHAVLFFFFGFQYSI